MMSKVRPRSTRVKSHLKENDQSEKISGDAAKSTTISKQQRISSQSSKSSAIPRTRLATKSSSGIPKPMEKLPMTRKTAGSIKPTTRKVFTKNDKSDKTAGHEHRNAFKNLSNSPIIRSKVKSPPAVTMSNDDDGFQADPDALASIMNNEGISGTMMDKINTIGHDENRESTYAKNNVLMFPDGRPSLCRRVPVDTSRKMSERESMYLNSGPRRVSRRVSKIDEKVKPAPRYSTNIMKPASTSRYSQQYMRRNSTAQGDKKSKVELKKKADLVAKKNHRTVEDFKSPMPGRTPKKMKLQRISASPAPLRVPSKNQISFSPLPQRSLRKKDNNGVKWADENTPSVKDELAKSLFLDDEDPAHKSPKSILKTRVKVEAKGNDKCRKNLMSNEKHASEEDCNIEIVSPSTLNVDVPDGCIQRSTSKQRKSVHFVTNPFESNSTPPPLGEMPSSPLCSALPITPAKEAPVTPSMKGIIPSIWDTPVQHVNVKHSPDAVVIRSDNVVRTTILSDIEWSSPTKIIADQTLPEEEETCVKKSLSPEQVKCLEPIKGVPSAKIPEQTVSSEDIQKISRLTDGQKSETVEEKISSSEEAQEVDDNTTTALSESFAEVLNERARIEKQLNDLHQKQKQLEQYRQKIQSCQPRKTMITASRPVQREALPPRPEPASQFDNFLASVKHEKSEGLGSVKTEKSPVNLCAQLKDHLENFLNTSGQKTNKQHSKTTFNFNELAKTPPVGRPSIGGKGMKYFTPPKFSPTISIKTSPPQLNTSPVLSNLHKTSFISPNRSSSEISTTDNALPPAKPAVISLRPPISPPTFGEAHLHRLLSPARKTSPRLLSSAVPSSPMNSSSMKPLDVFQHNLKHNVQQPAAVTTSSIDNSVGTLEASPSQTSSSKNSSPLSNLEPIAAQLRRISSGRSYQKEETNKALDKQAASPRLKTSPSHYHGKCEPFISPISINNSQCSLPISTTASPLSSSYKVTDSSSNRLLPTSSRNNLPLPQFSLQSTINSTQNSQSSVADSVSSSIVAPQPMYPLPSHPKTPATFRALREQWKNQRYSPLCRPSPSRVRDKFVHALLDEEVSLFTCRGSRTPSKNKIGDPVARSLTTGDDTHFVPIALTPVRRVGWSHLK